MRTTYHFVKVAAGEPFPFKSGRYTYRPKDTDKAYTEFIPKGNRMFFDIYILRPVEPAPVDNVALLEWVGREGYVFNVVVDLWGKMGENVYESGLTTAALIHEFINQKTKEV